MREIYALDNDINKDMTNENNVNFELSYPWEEIEEFLSENELKDRDKWQSIFMPSGSFVAGRIDNEHWLTFGTTETIPCLLYTSPSPRD